MQRTFDLCGRRHGRELGSLELRSVASLRDYVGGEFPGSATRTTSPDGMVWVCRWIDEMIARTSFELRWCEIGAQNPRTRVNQLESFRTRYDRTVAVDGGSSSFSQPEAIIAANATSLRRCDGVRVHFQEGAKRILGRSRKNDLRFWALSDHPWR